MSPADVRETTGPSTSARLRAAWRKYKWFLLTVVLPTLIAATYLYGVASDQYQSEAHYLVRTQGGEAPRSSSGLGALIGMGGGSSQAGASEAQSVADYLNSHDVVNALRRTIPLVQMFQRPEADVLSRLRIENPTPELLLKYYRGQVEVHYDSDDGITTLTTRAFRPNDAYLLATELLKLGEQRINEINARGYVDAVTLAQRRLQEADQRLRQNLGAVTRARQSGRDVDPAGSAEAQIGLVSRLEQSLSAARAQLATTTQLIGGSNPQVDALRQQVRSLEAQVAAQNGRLAGGSGTIASRLGNYEGLKMERELLSRSYDAANTSYEAARQAAVRQQLYLVRVVDPNLPVKSQYPKRALTLVTLLACLLVLYAMGWLVAAGVREHAA